MSENEILRRGSNSDIVIDQQIQQKTLLEICEPTKINERLVEESLREFYTAPSFPFCPCSDYLVPHLKPIIDRKKQLGNAFYEGKQDYQLENLQTYDGLHEYTEISNESIDEISRMKTRVIRDVREQFYQENGEFILDTEFFEEQSSRLANISFQQNNSLGIFQKNAILSERNNQTKNIPFQLEVIFGNLWFNKHSLQNQQERKFQQIRPFMQELSNISTYPLLAELSREIQFLNKQQRMTQDYHNQEIREKLKVKTTTYDHQVNHIKEVFQTILRKWEQLQQIRRNSRLQTVPWKLNVKNYDINNKNSYDIGFTPIDIGNVGIGATQEVIQQENKRKTKIEEEQYFIKIYINNNLVAKSQKVQIQWPSFRVPINEKFLITVYSAPSIINVEIIKYGIINTIIDTIPLILPGINAKTITSAEKRFVNATFASNGDQMRSLKRQAIQPSGLVYYRIQWSGKGSRMPPSSLKLQQQEITLPTQNDNVSNDYQKLFDIKDPRFPQQTMKNQIQQQITKGKTNLLPFVNVQSARHLLLKLKSTSSDYATLQIPLLEEQIFRRENLVNLLRSQQNSQQIFQRPQNIEGYFNPIQGIFQMQGQDILRQISELLIKIGELKKTSINSGGSSNVRFKITEEVINEYIFEQMQSPIGIFFKNLFTQERKLGPKIAHKYQPTTNVQEIQLNLHIRSGKNIPIRQSSYQKIAHFQEEQKKNANNMRLQMDSYFNYGIGMHRQQPRFDGYGNSFFNSHGINNNNQINYEQRQLNRVNSMIQLRFKKITKRTQCFQGPFPEWNQTIEFKYNLEHEKMTIQKILYNNEKIIKILIFDITEQSKLTQAISQARIKKNKYFLGSIYIPFSTIITMPSVTGIFKINRPLIIFSYGIKKTGLFEIQNDGQQVNKTQHPNIHSYLNLDLFTQPSIDSSIAYNFDKKVLSGSSNPQLLQKASDWLQKLTTKRYIKLWLNHIEEKSVFICQYLTNDISPPQLLGQDHLIQRAARYVSLIPFKTQSKLLENTEQFHLKMDEFLKLKMGEDHGILLCNYFNNIDQKLGRNKIKSYLLIGKAFPYGKCIFVLRRDTQNNNCQIWDPFRNESYFFPAKQYDTFCFCIKYERKLQGQGLNHDVCPMFEINCVVSQQNVFINNQQSVKPSNINFQLEDQSLWQSFMSQKMKTQFFNEGVLPTIQPQDIDFCQDLSNIAPTIEKDLHEYLRNKMQTQRTNHFKPYTFQLNTEISTSIYNNLLQMCELFCNDYRSIGAQSTIFNEFEFDMKRKYTEAVEAIQTEKNRIKQLIDLNKHFYGFTINTTYTTKQQIWQKVSQSQIHLSQNSDLQFVLAVRCFQYTYHLISVWIFIGSISQSQQKSIY